MWKRRVGLGPKVAVDGSDACICTLSRRLSAACAMTPIRLGTPESYSQCWLTALAEPQDLFTGNSFQFPHTDCVLKGWLGVSVSFTALAMDGGWEWGEKKKESQELCIFILVWP